MEDESVGPRSNTDSESTAFSAQVDDPSLHECFANYPINDLPHPNEFVFPLDLQALSNHQQLDQDLQQRRENNPQQHPTIMRDQIELIGYSRYAQDEPKIFIPSIMLRPLVRWYHIMLVHVGGNRLADTIAMLFYHPRLRDVSKEIVQHCHECQQEKLSQRGYGHLPPRNVELQPWRNVAVDLIGPWKIKLQNNTVIEFNALTMIDTDTNFVEACRIDRKTAHHIAIKFENTWLSRYPWPSRCIHDNGGEFTGEPFQALLHRTNIQDVPTTVRNPQANAICERMHQTLANMLRPYLSHVVINEIEANEIIDTALAHAMFAMRATIHSTMRISPNALIFGRDTFLNVPIIAEIESILQRRQHRVNVNANNENKRRIDHDYQVGQQVLKAVPDPTKLQTRFQGPFTITRVHVNGNVTLQINPHVTERINIRQVKPYNQ